MKYCFLFALSFHSFFLTAQQNTIQLPETGNKHVVIAHRGNHVNVPENTVASINEAVKAGADYVEIDLRTTKDGYLVIQHDGSLDRMTDGKGKVNEHTLEEIKKLKVKSNGAAAIYRVPEFWEILKACRNRINIYLDFKDADVAETYRQIRDYHMERHVVVYLNREPQYAEWKKVAPQMPLMTSLPEAVKDESGFDDFLKAVSIQVFDNITDSTLIAIAKKKGISVWLDVEDEHENPESWKKVIDLNVEGLQTDHPAALVDYLKKTKLR